MYKFHFFREPFLLLKSLTPYRLYNALKLGFSFWLARITGKVIMRGLPYALAIEPTTSCNLHCPECPSGLRQFSRPEGNMDWKYYRKIIDETHRHLLYLTLYFQGEPFLNPLFFRMVEYARSKNIFTMTSTNGHFLSPANTEKIVKSGLSKLIVSLDGTTQEIYSQYRKGGKLKTVLKGIENLVEAKKKLHSPTPVIELQFIVFKHNQHQIRDFKRLARKMGVDKYVLKTAQIYNFEYNDTLIPSQEKYSRYRKVNGRYQLKKKPHNYCKRMWRSPVITQNGELIPCCFDKQAEYAYGNVLASSFTSVWQSNKANYFRHKVFTNRQTIPICQNCTE